MRQGKTSTLIMALVAAIALLIMAPAFIYWRAPSVRRDIGNRTYLFYRNGCEIACGTFDLVLLEDGQVVDAIVRGRGHNYAGTSSSPPDRVAEFTPPQSAGTSGDIG